MTGGSSCCSSWVALEQKVGGPEAALELASDLQRNTQRDLRVSLNV